MGDTFFIQVLQFGLQIFFTPRATFTFPQVARATIGRFAFYEVPYTTKVFAVDTGALIGCTDACRRRATLRKCAIRGFSDLAKMTHPSRGLCPPNERSVQTE